MEQIQVIEKLLNSGWSKESLSVWRRAHHRCEYCGISLLQSSDEYFYGSQLDHIIPGGGDELENLALSCKACNFIKSDEHLEKGRSNPSRGELIALAKAFISGKRTENKKRLAQACELLVGLDGKSSDVDVIAGVLADFERIHSSLGPFTLKTSKPWHFNFSGDEKLPFESEHGVYLFTSPNAPDWDVPLLESLGKLWYVGKSVGGLSRRVWEHMGRRSDPETKKSMNPRFKLHRWAGLQTVPIETQDSIANGDVTIYAISISNSGSDSLNSTQKNLLPELLEKHLLISHLHAFGELPPLNLQL